MVGRDSAATTDRVRQASDIVEVVSRYVHLNRAGKDFKALCPFHKEKTPSFHVVPDKQIFKCFGCGVGGDVFKFVQMKENVDFLEARAILADRAGVSITDEGHNANPAAGPGKSDLERVNRWACQWFQRQLEQSNGEAVREYLRERGISDDSIARFRLGFAPVGWDNLVKAATNAGIANTWLLAAGLVKQTDDGRRYDAFRNRLIFPIADALERIVGFGGRTLGDDKAKYLNSPQSSLFDKRRTLYGLPTAREAFSEKHNAIVVEGYVDCIMAHQSGFQNTVATLGTALTVDHARILKRHVDQVTLIFDSDEAGRRAADGSVTTFLAENLDVRLSHVPEGKDPADLLLAQGAEAFASVLTSACDALEFKWKQVIRRYHTAATGPDRRRAIEGFLSLIATSAEFGACDPIQRGLILNQVGQLVGLSSEEVQRQMRIMSRGVARPEVSKESETQKRSDWRAQPVGAAAMRQLLEVLVNDPGFWPDVEAQFDINAFEDRKLRAIAAVVTEMAAEEGGFDLAKLLSRFESAEAARCITDLHMVGSRRGNFEATVQGALSRLRALEEQRDIERMTAELRRDESQSRVREDSNVSGGVSDGGNGEDARANARAINEGIVARKTNQFAARKHLAAPKKTGADLRG